MSKTLDSIGSKIFKCNKCPDLDDVRIYPMAGYWTDEWSGKLMIIGINPGLPQPGERESLERLEGDYKRHYEIGIKGCFVGAFIRAVLKVFDLTWEDIFLTNIIKCATPNCREPLAEEVKNCLPYLLDQLEVAKPRNILFLGRFPLKTLKVNLKFNEAKIAHGVNLMATYHPTYIRRQGLMSDTIKFLKTQELL